MIKSKPNFLFFLPDQFRFDWTELNDELSLNTPNLKRLAENGMCFNNAYTPSPLCAPARACLASGMDYDNCGVVNNADIYPLDLPTYYQALRDVSYNVAGVGKFDLHKGTSDVKNLYWGLNGSYSMKEWGFTHGIDNEGKIDGINSYVANNSSPRGPYLNYLHRRGLADLYIADYQVGKKSQMVYLNHLPDDAYCDNWVAENGLDILKDFSRDPSPPWHMVVNFTGPHDPMEVTSAMLDNCGAGELPLPIDYPDMNCEVEQKRRLYYAAMIENIDRQIGRYLDFLEETGQLNNTVIIFSSDHGEMLGDHGRHGKCVWYGPSVRVPLIISGPGVCAGKSSEVLVVIQDLAATMLDYADAKPLPEMEAKSLVGILSGDTCCNREYVHSALRTEYFDWQMLADQNYKYVHTGDDVILYDLKHDPYECENIIEKHPDIAEEFRVQLEGR